MARSGKPPRPARSKKKDPDDFLAAFAALLKSKKIKVPAGLLDAPPQAYASQTASFVDELAKLPKREIERFAKKVAGHAQRQAERARAEWESSPLIAELRRRGLKEPETPLRVTGANVSLAKPLSDWSDREILNAAKEWSRIGRQ